MGDDMMTIRLFSLACLDDDDKDTVRQYLIGDRTGCEIEWYDWEGDEDGGEGALQEQYKTDAATVMFFIDREALENNGYIVADGRCIRQHWYCQQVLEYYGIEYSDEDWVFNDDAVNLFENHAVPWIRFDAMGNVDILSLMRWYDDDDEYSILDSENKGGNTIWVSYSQGDYDEVQQEILSLKPDDLVEDEQESGEEEEAEDDAEEEEEEEEEE